MSDQPPGSRDGRAPRSGREKRELGANWLMMSGAVLLFASLFLPWSHQLSRAFTGAFGASGGLAGLPSDPTAWQVFSTVDVLFALLSASVLTLALVGPRRPREVALALCVVALLFVLHALASPPTNGVFAVTPPGAAAPGTGAPADQPSDGPGETIALVALLLAAGGLGLSLTAD